MQGKFKRKRNGLFFGIPWPQDDHALSLGRTTENCLKGKKVLPPSIPEDVEPVFVWDQVGNRNFLLLITASSTKIK